jgi:hypothetical protein
MLDDEEPIPMDPWFKGNFVQWRKVIIKRKKTKFLFF